MRTLMTSLALSGFCVSIHGRKNGLSVKGKMCRGGGKAPGGRRGQPVCDYNFFQRKTTTFLNSAVFSYASTHLSPDSAFRNFWSLFSAQVSQAKAHRSCPALFSMWVKKRRTNSATCCLIVRKQTRLISA